jgi:hypothetical protein
MNTFSLWNKYIKQETISELPHTFVHVDVERLCV